MSSVSVRRLKKEEEYEEKNELEKVQIRERAYGLRFGAVPKCDASHIEDEMEVVRPTSSHLAGLFGSRGACAAKSWGAKPELPLSGARG